MDVLWYFDKKKSSFGVFSVQKKVFVFHFWSKKRWLFDDFSVQKRFLFYRKEVVKEVVFFWKKLTPNFCQKKVCCLIDLDYLNWLI